MILKEVNVSVSDVVEILDDVEFREGNMNIYKLIFSMSEKLKELTSVAVFTTDKGEVHKTAIIDKMCYIPFEALKRGMTKLGVYSYRENELIYSPMPTEFFVGEGSYKEGSLTEEEFVLSDYERYLVLNQEILEEMKALASGGVVGKEIDPTVPQHVKDIKEQDIEKWNKVDELENVLQDILTIIQGGELNENQVADIEQLIVSYFENKTVEEVEK